MLRWFYVFAGWWSFCLSKTEPKRRNILVSILLFAEPSDGWSSSRLKCASRASRPASHCCFGTRASVDLWQQSERRPRKRRPCVSNHVQVTQNAPGRSTSGLGGMRARDLAARWQVARELQDGIDRGLFRSARAAVGLSIAKKTRILQTLRSRVLSSSWRRCVN